MTEQTPTLHAVSVKLPPFWPEDPALQAKYANHYTTEALLVACVIIRVLREA